jgi:hypothetical protein
MQWNTIFKQAKNGMPNTRPAHLREIVLIESWVYCIGGFVRRSMIWTDLLGPSFVLYVTTAVSQPEGNCSMLTASAASDGAEIETDIVYS